MLTTIFSLLKKKRHLLGVMGTYESAFNLAIPGINLGIYYKTALISSFLFREQICVLIDKAVTFFRYAIELPWGLIHNTD